MHIGEKLKHFREERSLSQVEMSLLLGIPETTYSRYERSETKVDFNKLVSFAEKLKIPIQDLMPDTFTINYNNNTSEQGGGALVFGNQYFYFGENTTNKSLLEENQVLKEKLELLEQKLDELLGKK